MFLSYSSSDAALAQRLAKDLRSSGLSVWLDQWDLKVGQEFAQSIEQGVDAADFVIVLLTHSSVASDWVHREWSRKSLREAEEKRVAVVPVRGERCEIPDFLAQRSHADISGGSYEPGFRQLLEILGHYSSQDGFAVPQQAIVEVEPDLDQNTLPIVSPIALEVSSDLIPIFEPRDDGTNRFINELLVTMREELAAEVGFAFPGVRIRGSDTDLPPGTAMIMIDEVPEEWLQIDSEGVDPGASLAAALKAVIRRCATEFVDIDLTRRLADTSDPALVDNVVPSVVSWIDLADVLRRLVAEELYVGDVAPILAAFSQGVPAGCDSVMLAERARQALAARITARFTGGGGALSVLRLAPEIESQVRGAIQRTSSGAYLAIEPQVTRGILAAIRGQVEASPELAGVPILTDADIRVFVRKLVELEFPALAVLSHQDVLPGTGIHPIREIRL